MSKSPELELLLKSADPQISMYVAALEKENAKLHRRIADLETKHVSAQNRAAALEKELEKRPPTYGQLLDELNDQG